MAADNDDDGPRLVYRDERGGLRPIPDPTALTTEALREAIGSLRTLIDQRISATERLFESQILLGREGGMALKELVEAHIAGLRDTATFAHSEIREYISQRAATAAELLDEKFEGRDKALVAALQAAKEAVEKANAATEKRFDNVQELLAQLGGAQGLLLPRAEAESRIGDLDRRVSEMKSTVDKGFTSTDTRHDMGSQYWGYLVGAVGILAIVVTIVIELLPPR